MTEPVTCEDATRFLTNLDEGSVQLCWTDPPFGTNRTRRLGDSAYRDVALDDVVTLIETICPALHSALHEDGVVAVCLDYRTIHQTVVALSEWFTFRGEIIWTFGLGRGATRWWSNKHNTIALFDKDGNGRFHHDRVPQVPRASGPMERTMAGKVYHYGETKPVASVWDITMSQSAPERVGYPNQKPLALISPFVQAHTDPGDLVVDPFTGSGSTGEAALALGRRFAGCDVNPQACEIANGRLASVQSAMT
jgi:site-specific DNA-methyltransferase (adenine-specific)